MVACCFPRLAGLIEPLEGRIAPAVTLALHLSTLDGSNGFRIEGEAERDYAGSSVSSAGDINGDGIADMLVGAVAADPNGPNSGTTYVVFGSSAAFSASLNLSELDGSNGFKIPGLASGDYTGGNVSGAGDINGDGFDDLLIGAWGADPNGSNSGAAYVVFGSAERFPAVLDLANLNGSNGFKIVGDSTFARVGVVSDAGDVNGDGLDDLLIGSTGASYVIFGMAGAFSPTLSVSSLDGINGFKINGEASGDGFGGSVSNAGDVNRDGFGDVLVGASSAHTGSGGSYVIFGREETFGPVFEVTSLDGTNGFKIYGEAIGDGFGGSVSGAGDVNGDGFDDLLIGAPQLGASPTTAGASYVIFGRATGFNQVFDLSDLNGKNGFKVIGESESNYSGRRVSNAGDVNGDGFGDLLLSSYAVDLFDRGTVYVIFGRTGGFSRVLDLSGADGATRFEIKGENPLFDKLREVSGAGDVNGDGFADLLLGAYGASPNGYASGATYVVFGKSDFLTGSFSKTKRSVNFTEADGNAVSIGLNKGDIARENITLAVEKDGFRLSELELTGKAGNQGATVTITANGGGAEVGLITVSSGARVSELRVIGDVMNLQVEGTVDSVHVSSFGVNQALFPELQGDLSFYNARARSVEVDANVNEMLLYFARGIQRLEIGGDLLAANFHTEGELKSLRVEGAVRDSLLSGLRSATPRSAAATYVFGTILIGGDFEGTQLLAGFDSVRSPARGASIGSIVIKGGFIASNIVAGASAGMDELFGTRDDLVVADDDGFVSSIGKIAILGPVTGSLTDATNGIVAEEIGSLQVGADSIIFSQGPRNDLPPRPLDDAGQVRVREVAVDVVVKLNLATLNGRNGFKISGAVGGDYVGKSVSNVGDMNGDGFDDFIVGAAPYGTRPAASYVIFGGPGRSKRVLDVSLLNGINGFQLLGETPTDNFGTSVGSAGDINGDGFADIAIGAPLASPNGLSSGATYVIFGKAGAFDPLFDLSKLDGTNGFKVAGKIKYNFLGTGVSTAGDVNGDGFDDLAIAAYGATPNGLGSGAAYVIYGKASGFASLLSVADLDGNNGVAFEGDRLEDLGSSISGGDDINGDGMADLLIGASGIDATYVVFGQTGGFQPGLKLSTLDGTNGFKIQAGNQEGAGRHVRGAGDVNGDGVDDLLMGNPFASANGLGSGAAYLVFGNRAGFTPVVDVSSLDGTNGFKIQGESSYDGSGNAVSSVGDTNGDGFGDIVIGADHADADGYNFGAAYIVFGKPGGFAPILNLSNLNGSNGFKIVAEAEKDYAGRAVSGAGDVNGDGFTDILIGATGVGEGENDASGAAYVVFGTPAIQIDERTVTYTEADGDQVLLQATSGTLTTGALEFEEVSANRYIVKTLDLRGENLDGAELTVHVLSSTDTLEGQQQAARGGVGITVFGADAGNAGIPNIGTLILPDVGGPTKIDIQGNVQEVTVPAAAAIKEFKVLSLGADTDLFPDIPRRFTGAGTIVKMTVENDVIDYTFDVPGAVDQMVVEGVVTGSKLSFSQPLKQFNVKGNVEESTIAFGQSVSKLTVTGNVEATQILAGYDAKFTRVNPDAQLGTVTIGGVLRASNVVAGASQGADGIFGTADDLLPTSGRGVVARIASITLGGVEGSPSPDDGFGIVAEEIGKLRIGSALIGLSKRPGNDLTPISLLPSGSTNDVFVREVVAGL